MTNNQLMEYLANTTQYMLETARKKNADYTGAVAGNPFANFTQVESLGIATTEQGFLTRMTDKLARVASFAKNGVLLVENEGVRDTLIDLANYALLMSAYLEDKRLGPQDGGDDDDDEVPF